MSFLDISVLLDRLLRVAFKYRLAPRVYFRDKISAIFYWGAAWVVVICGSQSQCGIRFYVADKSVS
jgi:hypothetical protein